MIQPAEPNKSLWEWVIGFLNRKGIGSSPKPALNFPTLWAARKMRAKVTTILSSFYIYIYQDVFKVTDVNSREAVKMDQNWRDVKGAFLSLGIIRHNQPHQLRENKATCPGRTCRSQARSQKCLQEGWQFWKIKTRSRRKPMIGTGPWGTGLWLYTLWDSMSYCASSPASPVSVLSLG